MSFNDQMFNKWQLVSLQIQLKVIVCQKEQFKKIWKEIFW